MAGFELFLQFAQDAGGLSAEEAKDLEARSRKDLAKAALAQADLQESEEATARFLALVVAAVASGRCHLAGAEAGAPPQDPEQWGWRKKEVGTGDRVREELTPQGTCVGWIDGEEVYLDPDSTFAATQRLAAEQGTSLPVTARTLWKRLAERGYLASRDFTRGKNLIRKTVAGKRRDVLHLAIGTLTDTPISISGPIGPIGPGPNGGKDLRPDILGPKPAAGDSQAQSSGPGASGGTPRAHKPGTTTPSTEGTCGDAGPSGPIGPEPEGMGLWEEGTI